MDFIRENKQILDTLDFDEDSELTARRQLLIDDIRLMVSRIRIFKTDVRWKWETLDLRTKGKSQRLIIDISWLTNTITWSMGTKCEVCFDA